jgi:uncharacterized membrane protein
VDILSKVALIMMSVAALYCYVRSYRPIKDGKLGRRLIDIGLALMLTFAVLVMGAYTSVTVSALVAGSYALLVIIGLTGGAGLLMLAIGVFYGVFRSLVQALRSSAQNRRYRRDQRKMKRRDQQATEQDEGTEFLKSLSDSPTER